MKPSPPQKQAFFVLLDRAVRKGEKVVSRRQKRQKEAGCSGGKTHQHRNGDALRK